MILPHEENNFWDVHQLHIVDPFKSFFANDKSEGKEFSSKVMWSLWYIYKRGNALYNNPDKETLVKRDVIGDVEYNFPSEIEDNFKNTLLTQAERSLLEWEEMMRKRDKKLKETDYEFDYPLVQDGKVQTTKQGTVIMVPGTAKQLDVAYKATEQLMSAYDRIQEKLAIQDSTISDDDLTASEAGEM